MIIYSKDPPYTLTRWRFFVGRTHYSSNEIEHWPRSYVQRLVQKKSARVKARERNLDLCDEYLHFISNFRSYHLVYMDETGCDNRIGFRRTGWSPLRIAPVQVSKFYRDKRYQILPAYAQDSIVLSRVS